MRFTICTVTALAVVVLAGCANRPGSPGMGNGQNYTPLVDTNGLDMSRYQNDLAGCRQLAGQIDPNKMAMDRMIAGALVGALVGAAAGGNRYSTQYGANYGATAGVIQGGAQGVGRQELVMANCMAGRGYRVLDANVPTNMAAPSPYVPTSAPAQAVVPVNAPAEPVRYSATIPAPGVPLPGEPTGTSTATPGCGWVGYQWKCPPK